MRLSLQAFVVLVAQRDRPVLPSWHDTIILQTTVKVDYLR